MIAALIVEHVNTPNCQCDECKEACSRKPGWFLPGEAEKAAELLNLSLPEFFRIKLMVDWYENPRDDGNIFVLAPALVGETPGEEYPGDPCGTCVFFHEGLCSIQEAKPFECRAYLHSDTDAQSKERHSEVARQWNTLEHQQQIRDLLGREPDTEEYQGHGMGFSGLFGLFSKEYFDR